MTRLTKLVAAGLLLAGLVGTSATPVGSEEAPLVVDVGVAVTSNPTTVSPHGGLVHYGVTVSNSASAVPMDVTLTDTTTDGAVLEVRAPEGATCGAPSGTNPTFSCDLTLAPNSSALVQLVVQTTSAPLTINSAEVMLAPSALDVVDLNGTNDTASAKTTVIDDPESSSAFLRPTESMTFKSHVLTVRTAEIGVVATMADADGTGAQCGPSFCSPEALHVGFSGGDPDDPFFGVVDVRVNFENGDPCYGNGSEKCYGLYYRKPLAPIPAPVPACPAIGEPCLESFTKVATGFERVVVMDTNDPDLLEEAKSLVGSGKG